MDTPSTAKNWRLNAAAVIMDADGYVLLGKDNQNIATSMHLAPSTVKVHMHHILQKAERANRKELIQDFWEFS